MTTASPAEVLTWVPATLGDGWRFEVTLARPDQWTLYPSQVAALPAHRLRNARDDTLYLSTAGEIIQRTTRAERLWAWLGPIPHWLYPAVLVQHRALWRQLVLWLAAVGIVTTLSGLGLGLWSLRRRRSPFARRWLRAHHYLGLGFGLVTFTWFGSGALSLTPLGWSPGSSPTAAEHAALGGVLASDRVAMGPAHALAACQPLVVRELELRMVLGRATWVCRETPVTTLLVDAETGLIRGGVDAGEVGAALVRAGHRVREATRLVDDAYVYASLHGGSRPPRLIRLVLADRGSTRIYVDARDGQAVARYGARARLERWLYHGVHSFDVPGLRERPGLRRAVALALAVGGLALAVTGMIAAVRWLGRLERRRRREPRP